MTRLRAALAGANVKVTNGNPTVRERTIPQFPLQRY